MNTIMLGGALMLLVCLVGIGCMFFVARRKQDTPTRESFPELYLQTFAVATTSIEERRRSVSD